MFNFNGSLDPSRQRRSARESRLAGIATKSRSQILAEAKAERDARAVAASKIGPATVIQRAWRTYKARRAVYDEAVARFKQLLEETSSSSSSTAPVIAAALLLRSLRPRAAETTAALVAAAALLTPAPAPKALGAAIDALAAFEEEQNKTAGAGAGGAVGRVADAARLLSSVAAPGSRPPHLWTHVHADQQGKPLPAAFAWLVTSGESSSLPCAPLWSLGRRFLSALAATAAAVIADADSAAAAAAAAAAAGSDAGSSGVATSLNVVVSSLLPPLVMAITSLITAPTASSNASKAEVAYQHTMSVLAPLALVAPPSSFTPAVGSLGSGGIAGLLPLYSSLALVATSLLPPVSSTSTAASASSGVGTRLGFAYPTTTPLAVAPAPRALLAKHLVSVAVQSITAAAAAAAASAGGLTRSIPIPVQNTLILLLATQFLAPLPHLAAPALAPAPAAAAAAAVSAGGSGLAQSSAAGSRLVVPLLAALAGEFRVQTRGAESSALVALESDAAAAAAVASGPSSSLADGGAHSGSAAGKGLDRNLRATYLSSYLHSVPATTAAATSSVSGSLPLLPGSLADSQQPAHSGDSEALTRARVAASLLFTLSQLAPAYLPRAPLPLPSEESSLAAAGERALGVNYLWGAAAAALASTAAPASSTAAAGAAVSAGASSALGVSVAPTVLSSAVMPLHSAKGVLTHGSSLVSLPSATASALRRQQPRLQGIQTQMQVQTHTAWVCVPIPPSSSAATTRAPLPPLLPLLLGGVPHAGGVGGLVPMLAHAPFTIVAAVASSNATASSSTEGSCLEGLTVPSLAALVPALTFPALARLSATSPAASAAVAAAAAAAASGAMDSEEGIRGLVAVATALDPPSLGVATSAEAGGYGASLAALLVSSPSFTRPASSSIAATASAAAAAAAVASVAMSTPLLPLLWAQASAVTGLPLTPSLPSFNAFLENMHPSASSPRGAPYTARAEALTRLLSARAQSLQSRHSKRVAVWRARASAYEARMDGPDSAFLAAVAAGYRGDREGIEPPPKPPQPLPPLDPSTEPGAVGPDDFLVPLTRVSTLAGARADALRDGFALGFWQVKLGLAAPKGGDEDDLSPADSGLPPTDSSRQNRLVLNESRRFTRRQQRQMARALAIARGEQPPPPYYDDNDDDEGAEDDGEYDSEAEAEALAQDTFWGVPQSTTPARGFAAADWALATSIAIGRRAAVSALSSSPATEHPLTPPPLHRAFLLLRGLALGVSASLLRAGGRKLLLLHLPCGSRPGLRQLLRLGIGIVAAAAQAQARVASRAAAAAGGASNAAGGAGVGQAALSAADSVAGAALEALETYAPQSSTRAGGNVGGRALSLAIASATATASRTWSAVRAAAAAAAQSPLLQLLFAVGSSDAAADGLRVFGDLLRDARSLDGRTAFMVDLRAMSESGAGSRVGLGLGAAPSLPAPFAWSSAFPLPTDPVGAHVAEIEQQQLHAMPAPSLLRLRDRSWAITSPAGAAATGLRASVTPSMGSSSSSGESDEARALRAFLLLRSPRASSYLSSSSGDSDDENEEEETGQNTVPNLETLTRALTSIPSPFPSDISRALSASTSAVSAASSLASLLPPSLSPSPRARAHLALAAPGFAPAWLPTVISRAPFLLPFTERAAALRRSVEHDKAALATANGWGGGPAVRVQVRRGGAQTVADALAALSQAAGTGRGVGAWKGRISVVFVDSDTGVPEAGIDSGGPFKEFVEVILAELFRPEAGLFLQTEPLQSPSAADDGDEEEEGETYYTPNPTSRVLPDTPALMHLAGVIIGKALYDGLLISPPLAPHLLALATGRPPSRADLRTLQPQIHKSLAWLEAKAATGDVDFSVLGLSFSVTEDVLGRKVTHPLKPNGDNIPVTADNLAEYTALLADHYLSRVAAVPTQALLRGLHSILPRRWLSLFDGPELGVLLCGSRQGIDVDDWRRYTTYNGTAADGDEHVKWFWEIVASFTEAERSQLLRFATGCSKPPLGGFRHVSPPFALRLHGSARASGWGASMFGADDGADGMDMGTGAALPAAATCFNLIKLPRYTSKAVMEKKLRQAMGATGFHLT